MFAELTCYMEAGDAGYVKWWQLRETRDGKRYRCQSHRKVSKSATRRTRSGPRDASDSRRDQTCQLVAEIYEFRDSLDITRKNSPQVSSNVVNGRTREEVSCGDWYGINRDVDTGGREAKRHHSGLVQTLLVAHNRSGV